MSAGITAGAIKNIPKHFVIVQLEHQLLIRRHRCVYFAALANGFAKTLRQYAVHRGGNHEWLHPHVQHTRDGFGGAVGVQGAHIQVTGQRCFNADRSCLQIPHLTHENDVRVLTQKRFERFGKGHAHGLDNMTLYNAFHREFYWILRGENLGINGVQHAQAGIKRGGFPGARRSGHKEHPVWLHDAVANALIHFCGYR